MNIRTELLKEFDQSDLEWRVQQCGVSNNGKTWVMALVYVNARAIQNRLDDVFGWDNWSDEYRETSAGNFICKLSVCVDGRRWVSKENGASETEIEAFKGGISGSFKRVASSGFGIGRYLYNIDVKFVESSLEKKPGYTETTKTKDKKHKIYWKIPVLNKVKKVEKVENMDIEKAKQIKKVFEMAETQNITKENINKVIYKVFEKDSIVKLTKEEIETLIERLKNNVKIKILK